MSDLVKYQKPESLEHAIQLAHIEKQWASKMNQDDLKLMLTKSCVAFCDAIGQNKVTDGVFSAGLDVLIDLVNTKYKTLHIDELRTALKRYAANDSIEVKNFSGSTLSKALSLYEKERGKKILAMRKAIPEPEPKELTLEEKRQKLELFYQTWKKMKDGNGLNLFAGYSAAYVLAKEIGELNFDKSEFWAYIEQAKEVAIVNLKNLQTSRAISGVVYNNRLTEINIITFESVFGKEKKPLPNEVIAECRQLAIVDYFKIKEFEE